jgi:hypothetical protein
MYVSSSKSCKLTNSFELNLFLTSLFIIGRAETAIEVMSPFLGFLDF